MPHSNRVYQSGVPGGPQGALGRGRQARLAAWAAGGAWHKWWHRGGGDGGDTKRVAYLFHWNVHVIPMIFPWYFGTGEGEKWIYLLIQRERKICELSLVCWQFWLWFLRNFMVCCLPPALTKRNGYHQQHPGIRWWFSGAPSGSPGAWSCGQGGRRGLWSTAASSSQSERSHIQNIENP